jgi:hypothetical protein
MSSSGTTQPQATLIQIADAVVAGLNGHSFSQSFIAERHYRPVFELSEMADLKVSVVPLATSSQWRDRSGQVGQYQLDIGVQQKGDLSFEWLDGLMYLVDEIAEHLQGNSLTIANAGTYPVRCLDVTNAPVYALEHLEELRQFTSVLTVTYQVG